MNDIVINNIISSGANDETNNYSTPTQAKLRC